MNEMADEQRSAIGLSIGATDLAAVTADRAVTRKPVLTLYGQHPPEVGVPSENPKLTEPGLVITDFVDRVGDPAGIVAADGTAHRSETLLAEGLRALAYTATDGRTLPMAAITYPAHWARPAVDALRAALNRVPEWSGDRLSLLPDSAAALTALQIDPGLPARGVIAVCDFGGSGTSLTLVNAANGYQSIAPTVRYAGFSGDMIDQALLNHVVADVSAAGGPDAAGTASIGSVTALRAACRQAKEELSSSVSATLTVDLPGKRDDIRITRAELDDVIRRPLDGFVNVIRETLQRNRVPAGDLVAVASVGGGASIPAVTTTLSEQLRVPVIAAPRPRLTAAIGAALTAEHGPTDGGATALAPTAWAGSLTEDTAMTDVVAAPGPKPALAWSEVDDDSGIMPIRTGEYPAQPGNGGARTARPQPAADRAVRPREAGSAPMPWYSRPAVVIVGTALVVLAVGAAILIALRHTSGSAPTTPPGVSSTPVPGTFAPGTESSSPSGTTDTQAPASTTPSSTGSQTTSPSTTTQTPSTTTQTPTTTTQPSTTTTQAPTTATTTQAPTSTRAPALPVFPRFPGRSRFGPQPGQPGG